MSNNDYSGFYEFTGPIFISNWAGVRTFINIPMPRYLLEEYNIVLDQVAIGYLDRGNANLDISKIDLEIDHVGATCTDVNLILSTAIADILTKEELFSYSRGCLVRYYITKKSQ